MEFEKIPVYWINRLSVLLRSELVSRFRQAGHQISAEEWAILLLLWQKDGQNPGDMSMRTVRDPTTMTRLVDAMVRKDLVERRQDTVDRRRSGIFLTGRGRELKPELVGLAVPMIEQSLTGISPEEQETTMRVLARMVENMNQLRNDRGA